MVLHAKHRPKPPLDSITVGDASVEPTSSTRNIGAIFDDTMSFENHVNELCRTAFYHIRNISRICSCLSIDSTKTVVHALVTSCLDHCNSLLYGLPDYLIQRLQYVMNAAAKVITCKRKFDHVTPLLIELHWLPVRQRIVFKILLYTFKALHGATPTYLTELVSPMFLGELLGLLTNFYWSSQRTSSNWLAWGLSQCARLTSGTRFHLRLKVAHLSLSLKLSLRPIFFDKRIFRTFRLSTFSILRIFFYIF